MFRQGNEELPEDMMLFVVADHTAQLGLRIVQWLEGLASKVLDLDNEVRGSHVGTYLPSSRSLLRAGRLEEACDLCRSAGRPWRAAILCPFGGLDLCPSVEALVKNGKNGTLQAIELESGIGHQWCLWKWATYCVSERIAEQDGGKYETAVYAAQCSNLKRILPICTDWESACWAMAKSWLDVQVDLELARLQPGGMDQFKTYEDAIDRSHGQGDSVSPSTVGPENWPLQVLNQQPRHLVCASSETPFKNAGSSTGKLKPYGDPQMIRFGAHLVLVLRYLLVEQMKGAFKEKIMTVGDLILHIVHVKYKIFVSAIEYLPFSPGDDSKGSFEEIVERVLSRSREIKPGKYDKSSDIAEQHRLQSLQKAMVIQWLCFTPPSTINDAQASSAKLLLRALLHSNILFREFALISMWRVPAMPIGAHTLLSFLAEPLKQPTETLLSTEDHDVSENLREFQDWICEYYSCDATYRNWLKVELENVEVSPLELSVEEKQRAIAAAEETLNSSFSLLLRKENPWLVPTEDRIYESVEPLFLELHAIAMLCLPSGECMCPDATLCATLMSALYSSLSEEVVLNRQLMVSVSISSTDNYCIEVVLCCLATDGDGLGPHELNDGGILATVIAAGFKGELVRFQAGITMEISRLDAWYSSKDGSLEGPATYIVRGFVEGVAFQKLFLDVCRKFVRETKDLCQQQLQEFLLLEREYCICKLELGDELPC
ncbi:Nuclear pore complex protein NUP107 [Camellia lanceoleosa]|uniref:Nuclear pore complex protein NUP107 n=1 Tax=Camellia lanceoleosa TaxID=1840588 RepID=A0ACC0IPD7_9ERIC|nr:Nuclear pore complex protein NUP107 [Camellia lanceoleosa]